MTQWMWALVLLSPDEDKMAVLRAPRRKQAFAGRWVDHSPREKTLAVQTPRGRVTLAYDQARVCGVPVEQLWAHENIGLALSTFGRAMRVRRWLSGTGEVVVELFPAEARLN